MIECRWLLLFLVTWPICSHLIGSIFFLDTKKKNHWIELIELVEFAALNANSKNLKKTLIRRTLYYSRSRDLPATIWLSRIFCNVIVCVNHSIVSLIFRHEFRQSRKHILTSNIYQMRLNLTLNWVFESFRFEKTWWMRSICYVDMLIRPSGWD